MESRWVAKNIDLDLLTNSIIDFFKMLDFEIVREETKSGYAIFADNSSHFRMDGYVSVTIQGKPEDFIVKLGLHKGEKKRSFFISPLLMTMIGAGFLLSRRFKSEEAWLKLEKEFWRYFKNLVVQLTDSFNPTAGQ